MIQLPNYLQIDGRVAMGSSDVREKEIGDGDLVPVEISTIRSDSQLVMTENLEIDPRRITTWGNSTCLEGVELEFLHQSALHR